MVHINHRIGVKASLPEVYQALATVNGVSNWWTKNVSGESSIGKNMLLKFHNLDGKELGNMNIQIVNLIPEKTVHWKFIFGPEEWIGTEVIFELHQEKDYTIVMFSHINWTEEVAFKSHCSMKWAVFLLSLKQFIETGQGNPAPNDIKIDNWN